MKSSENEDALSQTLSEWRVEPAANPGFRASVWARIAATGRVSSWPDFLRAHAAAVGVAAMLALVLGGWAGHGWAKVRTEEERAAVAGSYVRSLDARTMTMP